MLEYFRSTADVAAFRSVLPVARLNTVVLENFSLLFLPLASRLFSRGADRGINDLYWQSAAWMALLSLPIFALTFVLAEPVTVLFFGERYADSATILAMLSLGYYFNGALGLNAETLKVYGRVRTIIGWIF